MTVFFSSCWSKPETSRKVSDDLFFGSTPDIREKFAIFFWSDGLFFWRTLAHCVLGLEKVRPRKIGSWPRIFFVFLAFASSLVFSHPPMQGLTTQNLTQYNYIQPQPLVTVGVPMPTIAMRRISPMHNQIQKLLKNSN